MPPLLVNPSAGRLLHRRLEARLPMLERLDVRTPGSPQKLVEAAADLAAEGHDRVLVAGGDGTIHHAIRGLAGTACALGIVPLGSGNDLARGLGLPLDPEAALQRALGARPRAIDLGRLGDRRFAGVLGVGFDGEVARFVNERLHRFRGAWIYPYAVARTLFAFRPPHVRIESDAGAFAGHAMLAVAANSPYFGGGMRIAPDARLDDGLLDVVVVRRMSPLRFLAVFPRVYRGTHVPHPDVATFRAGEARISADRGMAFYADGEPMGPCGRQPSRVETQPGALWVAA